MYMGSLAEPCDIPLFVDPGAGVDLEGVRALDSELVRLARGAGRLRLRIGQALLRLEGAGGFHELGFPTLSAYAYERCSRSGRWAAESRALARRLVDLPAIQDALEHGRVGWSMAEVLARYATADSEGELLVESRGRTVRETRALLKAAADAGKGAADSGGHAAEGDQEEERLCTLTLTMPVEEAWALEATKMLAQHMDGDAGAGAWLESVLGEGQTSMLDVVPQGAEVLPADVIATQERWKARRSHFEERRARAEVRAEASLVPAPEDEPGEAPEEDDIPEGLLAIDERIQQWCAELASRDLWLGRMAAHLFAVQGWRVFGYATETQYARERLGVSRASIRAKTTLAKRARCMDRVVEAVQRGEVGFEAAGLLVRVAREGTAEAWVGRAKERTFKHLREEVQAVELAGRLLGEEGEPLPPIEEDMEVMADLEREVLTGVMLRRALGDGGVQISGTSDDGGADPVQSSETSDDVAADPVQSSETSDDVEADPVQSSGTRASPLRATATLRLRMREDTALHFRQLEEAHRRAGVGESFPAFLCLSFWRTWAGRLGKSDRWEHIYRRDLYRCTSPVCSKRECTLHHIAFRSHGGGDEPGNLTSPCAWCHLEGAHGRRLRVHGSAGDLRWELGREPILVVEGRRKRAA